MNSTRRHTTDGNVNGIFGMNSRNVDSRRRKTYFSETNIEPATTLVKFSKITKSSKKRKDKTSKDFESQIQEQLQGYKQYVADSANKALVDASSELSKQLDSLSADFELKCGTLEEVTTLFDRDTSGMILGYEDLEQQKREEAIKDVMATFAEVVTTLAEKLAELKKEHATIEEDIIVCTIEIFGTGRDGVVLHGDSRISGDKRQEALSAFAAMRDHEDEDEAQQGDIKASIDDLVAATLKDSSTILKTMQKNKRAALTLCQNQLLGGFEGG